MADRHPTRQLSEDEWIVLLDVYQTHRGEPLSAKHPTIVKASETLNALGERDGRRSGPNFRSPSGLQRQIATFKYLDPAHRSGDHKVPPLAESVWRRFSNDPHGCRIAADAIRKKTTQ